MTQVYRTSLVAGVVLALSCAGSAWAEEEKAKDGQHGRHLFKATELIGIEVQNPQRKELGNVEEIVLDSGQNRVAYVVVSFGGFLGMGEKLFAMPWSAGEVSQREEKRVWTIRVDRQKLKDAPGFDADNWPDMANAQFAHDVDAFYKEQAEQREERAEAREATGEGTDADVEVTVRGDDQDRFWVRRLSKIVGTEVRNRRGEGLGEVEEVMIDQQGGKIAYALLSFGGGWGADEKLVAVPWSALQFLPVLGTARMDADRQTLETLAFQEGEAPNLADEEYARRTYKQFDREPYWEVHGFDQQEQRTERSAWAADSEYNRKYDRQQEMTIKGRIASIGTFTPDGTDVEGLRLKIKADDGNSYVVQAGPKDYVNRQKINLNYGDQVRVIGAKSEGWIRDVLIAREIRKGDKTLTLRDESGQPAWNVADLQSQQRDQRRENRDRE